MKNVFRIPPKMSSKKMCFFFKVFWGLEAKVLPGCSQGLPQAIPGVESARKRCQNGDQMLRKSCVFRGSTEGQMLYDVFFEVGKVRGENLRWMSPRCLADASQMPPRCLPDPCLLNDSSSKDSSSMIPCHWFLFHDFSNWFTRKLCFGSRAEAFLCQL